ncbi:polyketide synthase [Asticcacaulis sp. BYS171W]|uniref:Polyketide synthase n=1 Tax=Asticcacaulis aquaticus TaxID=2984212 RepID=A0ABT5HV64_9CAUL|nr:polyketide synthase [Asticcacaulis aquaticus]MDC7683735.1 polyketide synthase [Asticcacaulis aquaticus]
MSAWLQATDVATDLIHVAMTEDGIAEMALRDVDGKNGMSPAWVKAFIAGLAEVAQMPGARVLLLSGLPDYFCTGATKEVLKDLVENRLMPGELTLGRQLIGFDLPVVAAAEGHAIGGGLALLLSCDLGVISETSRYGANFMTLGITPGMGTTRLLEEALGRAIAHEMIYTGDLWRGRRFAGTGAFNAVVPATEVRDRALLLARGLADKPRDNLIHLKRSLSLPRRLAFETAMTTEPLMHALSLRNLDTDLWGAP